MVLFLFAFVVCRRLVKSLSAASHGHIIAEQPELFLFMISQGCFMSICFVFLWFHEKLLRWGDFLVNLLCQQRQKFTIAWYYVIVFVLSDTFLSLGARHPRFGLIQGLNIVVLLSVPGFVTIFNLIMGLCGPVTQTLFSRRFCVETDEKPSTAWRGGSKRRGRTVMKIWLSCLSAINQTWMQGDVVDHFVSPSSANPGDTVLFF